MVKVKICGITNLEDAQASANAGCDALGFVFYKKSPRYILPEKAAGIIRKLPGTVMKIGVFVNAREKTIRRIIKRCGINILQFHGRESIEFCRRFKDYKIIKAFRMRGRMDPRQILRYKTFAYLFDAFMESKPGGTGKNFNWKLVRHIDGITRPVFLSGGLSSGNVKKAIEVVRPEWVDVSSSVEIKPGKKDHKKVREFIKAAKSKS
ncbi:MAG: phosphoribosylanthranilate isomerase [Candidatus Omnitrophica bacterium]|nr:phosphoribosylanthranilate isomerase [Candidatus Omnitrophota bacterium]MDD5553026.1 phosphoribosylanthranilate isomerase [Candidatus Omnitrophota bacterium]